MTQVASSWLVLPADGIRVCGPGQLLGHKYQALLLTHLPEVGGRWEREVSSDAGFCAIDPILCFGALVLSGNVNTWTISD